MLMQATRPRQTGLAGQQKGSAKKPGVLFCGRDVCQIPLIRKNHHLHNTDACQKRSPFKPSLQYRITSRPLPPHTRQSKLCRDRRRGSDEAESRVRVVRGQDLVI